MKINENYLLTSVSRALIILLVNYYDTGQLVLERMRKGMTQSEVAAEAGLSVGSVHAVENGAQWKKAIRKMARVLGISIPFIEKRRRA